MNPSRRKFFSGAGIIGGLIAGVGAAKLTVEVVEKKKQTEDISHLAPSGGTNIMLTADNKPKEVKPAGILTNGQPFYFAGVNTPLEEMNKVTLSVGHDDRLWMKIGEKWHRVAIES